MQTLTPQKPSNGPRLTTSIIVIIAAWTLALFYVHYSPQIVYPRSTLYSYPKSDPRWAKELTQEKALISLRGLISAFSKAMRHHSVQYWIDEGTLLGTYRQHDIIPWDTDVDVSIMAMDAPRLFQVNKSIPENYYLELWDKAREGEAAMLNLGGDTWRSQQTTVKEDTDDEEVVLPVRLPSENTRDPLIVGRLYDQQTGLHLDIFQFFDNTEMGNLYTAWARSTFRGCFGCAIHPKDSRLRRKVIARSWIVPTTACMLHDMEVLCPHDIPKILDYTYGAHYLQPSYWDQHQRTWQFLQWSLVLAPTVVLFYFLLRLYQLYSKAVKRQVD